MKCPERRALARSLELRAAQDSVGTVAGYAAMFNARSEPLGDFVEIIAPGAFSDTIADDIRALWNHDDGDVLGRTKSGTLRLSEDDTGLACEIDLPDTEEGNKAATLIRRGDVSGMSFGFQTMEDDWAYIEGTIVRTLVKVRLFEVSIVTFPAYPDTSVALRSLSEFRSAQPAAANAMRARMNMALRLAAAR